MSEDDGKMWSAAAWEGSRGAQLRRALQLTPRQPLEAMIALIEAANGLASLRPNRDGEAVRTKVALSQGSEQ